MIGFGLRSSAASSHAVIAARITAARETSQTRATLATLASSSMRSTVLSGSRRTQRRRLTTRYYVELGLLPGPEQRGVQTVYTHAQLLRLQAIPILRKRDRLRLPMVKRHVNAMSDAEVEALVAPPKPPVSSSPGAAPPPHPCVR